MQGKALQAWSMFSGGEMALATEQGDIQGESTERILKIIATEKTHVARAIGQNQSFVNLTSVLCVDTNRTVALSDEMDGRKVLIQFKDRPKNETDIQRERIFKKYWDTFTTKDKIPDISGCIGFLLNSLDYFNELAKMYIWKNVEVFNDIDLDDFQTALINALQEIEFVQRTDNEEVIALSNQVYGKNMNALNKSLSEIGVEAISKKINAKKVRGYSISNKDRFNKDRFNKFIDE
uniref:Putative phage-resistance protein n=1 Tax=Enterobacteria phage phi50 TaxID=36342 RepID=Q00370_9VIRU|nr:bacteriophage resistance protein - Lactococcus lactis (strain nck202.50) [Lactococcus lactis]AAA72952.1 putative phage-resistance protein [Enterobacteria phage phi50]